jgi:hypothetical protein
MRAKNKEWDSGYIERAKARLMAKREAELRAKR